MALLKHYLPDGSSRALWARPFAATDRRHGLLPRRGSHVKAVEAGPRRGLFQVDLSALAEVSGRPEHRVCLTATFETHEEAVAAERAWLLAHWVLGGGELP